LYDCRTQGVQGSSVAVAWAAKERAAVRLEGLEVRVRAMEVVAAAKAAASMVAAERVAVAERAELGATVAETAVAMGMEVVEGRALGTVVVVGAVGR